VGSTFISFACGIECAIWFIASLSPSPAVCSTFIRFASGTDVAIWFNASGTTTVGYALISFAFGIFIAILFNTSRKYSTFNFNTIFFLHSSL
jgi:ABC-type microcin C transport system permease subunit YejB